MVLGHHIDAARNILHGFVGLESGSLGYQTLGFIGRHAFGQFHQHMGSAAHTLLYEQNGHSAKMGRSPNYAL